ncbi:hypothetical protein ACVW00_000263 [Marmoricola sp. URHA0025 HA25]
MGPREGRVVVVGEGRPLTAEAVVGRQLAAQSGVLDLPAQVRLRDGRGAEVEQPGLLVVQDAGHHDALEPGAVDPASQPLGPRLGGEQLLQRARDLEVGLGRHPDRGSLVDGELRSALGDLRDQLDGRGPRADHRHPLAVEVGGLVPLRGVDDGPGEVADAVDVGQPGLGEEAGRRHQVRRRARGRAPAGRRGRRDHPVLLVLVPASAFDPDAELHVPAEVVLVGDVLGVRLQLRAAREPVLPARVGLERVGVGDARDVDGEAGVVVHVPGPAEVVLAVQDHEVVVAEALQADRRPHPAEAGAHDDHVVVGRW